MSMISKRDNVLKMTHSSIFISYPDCFHLWITAPSFNDCCIYLTLSHVLFCLKDVMDLSHIKKGISYFFKELMDSLNVSELQLSRILNKNAGKAGMFELEWSHANAYFSIPFRAFVVREKCYGVDILFQRGENEPMQLATKIAARSGVTKVRSLKYSIEDLIRFSRLDHVEYERNLTSLRTKTFKMFEISVKRRVMNIFSRKRYLLKNGESVPFAFYNIPRLMNDEAKHAT